jgi:hypothetical protein
VFREHSIDPGSIVDVATDKDVVRVPLKGCKVSEISGIGQKIQIDDPALVLRDPVQDKIRSNKSSPAGDENWMRTTRHIFEPL